MRSNTEDYITKQLATAKLDQELIGVCTIRPVLCARITRHVMDHGVIERIVYRSRKRISDRCLVEPRPPVMSMASVEMDIDREAELVLDPVHHRTEPCVWTW